MLDKEKDCTACSGSGCYYNGKCGACNGTGLEYSKDEIIEALEAENKRLQNTIHNTAYTKCSCELAELQRSSSVIDSIKIMGILKKHFA